jgi:predicted dehydrogenase
MQLLNTSPFPDHRPTLTSRRDWRIGCIGSGFVMRDCHLVAYRNAGFNPVAIASRSMEAAKSVAELRGISVVHDSIDAILHDESIEVLDFAVPPQVQAELIRQAITAGRGRLRGILAQKPLAMSVDEARDLVNRADAAGIAFAVNQNMRFDPAVRSAKGLIDRGDLGTIVLASIDMRAVPHWMPWAQELPSLSTFVMSIHHLDTFRYWLGDPQRVLASTRPDPRTRFGHVDGINLVMLEYADGRRAITIDDVFAGPITDAHGITFRIEGTHGVARGTIGWPKYPAREPSTLEFCTMDQPGVWHQSDWSDAWFPDAFAGTMGQLLVAIESGTSPAISARDNLATLALCESVFTAATEHRVINFAEQFRP